MGDVMSDGTEGTPPPPSPDWELAGRRTVRFAVAYAFAAAAVIPLFSYATRNPIDGVTVQALLVIANIVISALLLGVILGLLVCMVVWLVQTARLAYGAPSTGHLGYWGIVAFGLLFVAAYLPSPGLSPDAALLVSAGERLLGVILLIAGVTHTRRWIGRRAGPVPTGEAQGVMSGQPTSDDWSAAWDPDVERDIERRRDR